MLQLFLSKYALYRIDPAGITGKLAKDRVGEAVAAYHRIVMQPNIAPAFLRYEGLYEIHDHPCEEGCAEYREAVNRITFTFYYNLRTGRPLDAATGQAMLCLSAGIAQKEIPRAKRPALQKLIFRVENH